LTAIGMYVGIGLMIVCVLGFIAGRRGRTSVTASSGAVAVGGDNSGSIANTNSASSSAGHKASHFITKLAIFIELVGIGVTLWHAYHLATK
jgi:hypothetical protein